MTSLLLSLHPEVTSFGFALKFPELTVATSEGDRLLSLLHPWLTSRWLSSDNSSEVPLWQLVFDFGGFQG